MSEQISIIESEHKRLSDLSTQLSEHLTKVKNEVAKLRLEKQKAIEQLKEIGGALQAYGQTLGLLKGAVKAPVAPVTVEGTAEVVSETAQAA